MCCVPVLRPTQKITWTSLVSVSIFTCIVDLTCIIQVCLWTFVFLDFLLNPQLQVKRKCKHSYVSLSLIVRKSINMLFVKILLFVCFISLTVLFWLSFAISSVPYLLCKTYAPGFTIRWSTTQVLYLSWT